MAMFWSTGKHSVVITGGGSGIGLAIATRILNMGHEVIIVGRNKEKLAAAVTKFPNMKIIQGDVATADGRVALVETILKDFPQVNVLVNNAGIQQRNPPLKDQTDWSPHEEEIAINFAAPIHLSILLLPHLTSKPSAEILNVTSGLSFVPLAHIPTYSATKAAMHSFTLSLRHQLKSTSVRVREIIPPAVNTDLGGKGLHDFGMNLDEYADSVIANLLKGDDNVEFGCGFSEKARLATNEEKAGMFNMLNN